ncbi:MAG: glycosyltransferase family 9 protein [Phenylobacterium sp.]|uniref:glycosyltransferase family 9 protein n=1 Tax=Phenylobacterium sp. TaxID=1871053 RepID=UPI0027327AED|nr:glycosyltransferase family 9 protein [Phenylobacterium sp.]MDP3172983.1 glycosyltransferase family 9 protein [Phenylobacterium sp.]
MERILVIKLSALGDFVQATGCMKAIRAAHPQAHLVLLTTTPYADLGRACGWFDEVWSDGRPAWRNVGAVARLITRMRRARFSRVYDLQTQGRTNRYFQLLWPNRPAWSGAARGAAFEDKAPGRDRLHLQDLQRRQLAVAGITDTPPPDLSWLRAEIADLGVPDVYALLVPGGAAHRPAKRWPVASYAALARRLVERGVTPVILGHGEEEATLAEQIRAAAPRSVSLVGRTPLAAIAELARGARLAVGNDTGPIHLIAAAGAPVVVLFSADSDPAMSAPRAVRPAQSVAVLREPDITQLTLEQVWAAAAPLL